MLDPVQQLEPRTLVPLANVSIEQLLLTRSEYLGPTSTTVTQWLTAIGQLHRSAAGSSEFYEDAARFAVETVGLDNASIFRLDSQSNSPAWQLVGRYGPAKTELCDLECFDRFTQRAVTWYQPAQYADTDSIVIAPVFDADHQLIAAIYGSRHTGGINRRRGIRPLEARLVQLLADSVAVGITRLQQETEATRTRVLLEQAFSPTVAEHIQNHPDSLAGQERDVTLLFADLRGYTSLAETLKLTDCYDLLGDVMEALTQVVVRQRGIVVDYYGDGLLALWNAPLKQTNHADLACSAAIEMFDALPAVSETWQARLDEPLELGIGIHSGPAFVGNAGTRNRIKYGPRGNTVNIASRVQAASKQLKLPLVITANTQAKLSDEFFTLRVCTAKLPGLEQPAELFTAYPATDAANIKGRLDEYSQALELFEMGELEAAEALLSKLQSQGPATPADFLAQYTAAQKNGNLGRRAVDKYTAQDGPIIEIQSK